MDLREVTLLKATSSQLVYGTTLRLPSDLISSESLQTSVKPTYVSKDTNDNIRNPLKTPLAENAMSATKLFTISNKILVIEPVLRYIFEKWISKNIPAKCHQNIHKNGYSM
ncbi:hypothetical protein TNCV_4410161 [Trichonephila clavipes]|nr:hypothetical protein TNCV_4410161 [Trichonephila clavipes]